MRKLRFSERQTAFIPTMAANSLPAPRYDLLPDRSKSAGPSYFSAQKYGS